MGSTVSIAVALLLTGWFSCCCPNTARGWRTKPQPLLVACLILFVLAGIARRVSMPSCASRRWRYAAQRGLAAMLAVALWTYWPKS
jgi:hypothetical protein